ncbi:hypothetical protein [Celeribacter marinus]|uniref:Uncharacterized protein n=1 Tax=Celeribacter marinus TaxID=1397108 RepID=A0A0P0ACN8_9RHOB|nr:hypothetical protein [Celeribacter marinus]ALI55899.1 hypothetical protein IMCC12053_1952 [Celeribacter marinus]SFK89011.1 hypothetical protein SAMN05444421_11024 [Celeribacter marinus]
MVRAFVLLCAVCAPLHALADTYARVQSGPEFTSAVEGRALTRLGIELVVSKNGAISGRAFGKDVTGAWVWDAGYFCRDLFFGAEDLGPNCQTVEVNGTKIKFTADRGTGQSATFSIR